MRIRSALVLVGLIAACSDQTATPAPTGTDNVTQAPSRALPPSPSAEATESNTAEAKEIPVALHGRWGLVPADCTTTRGDEKGLLTVSASDLRHYESVGKLRNVATATDTSFSGTFAYSGEGMKWTRDVTMSIQADGKNLAFRDSGADAPPSSRIYTRCP